MLRLVALLFVVAFLVGDGILSGFVSGRWSDDLCPLNLSNELPAQLADFEKIPSKAQNPKTLEVAGITQIQEGAYRYKVGSGVVSLMITAGKPNLLSSHTPEVCYPGSGFEQQGEIQAGSTTLSSNKEFPYRKGVFARKQLEGEEKIVVIWSWYARGKWQAPTMARMLAFSPSLAKVYIVHSHFQSEAKAEEACLAVWREIEPKLNAVE